VTGGWGSSTADGYRKITDGWYDPILNAGGDKGTLRNIENIVGSALTMYRGAMLVSTSLRAVLGMISLRVAAVRIPSSIEPRVKVETRSLTLVNDIFHISASGFGGLRAGTTLSTAVSKGIFFSSAPQLLLATVPTSSTTQVQVNSILLAMALD